MQFITSGNRIAVENFIVGYLYTITFTNGNYINTACTGIGIDFVMFSRTQPEYTFALTMETAVDVSSIDIYSEGGGTTNYNELTNKPQINSVTLTGNLSLSDLGIQPVINADNMLSYTLVSGLGTAATTAASDYATAAQGALAATAVQPADLNAYQTKIDNSSKLSADLVDDTSTTNKFATAAELSQIETNKNNILYNTNQGVKNLFNLTKVSGTYNTVVFTVNSDKTVTVNGTASPANSVFNLDNWTCTKAGTYVISGTPSGGSWAPSPNTYRIRVAVNGTWKGDDVGNGYALTLAVGDVVNLQINTSTSYTANNLVFKPMICLKSLYDADPTYQPYAMSNAEITAWILAHS